MRIQRNGNELRESSASAEQGVSDNLPGLFAVEKWNAYYWTMDADGRLQEGRALINILQGIGDITPEVKVGENGVIEHVRRWGVALRGGLLELLGFDPTPYLTHDRTRFANDDAEALNLVTNLTHFDLPGHFIIASEEHPFLLFDPDGRLKGTFTRWYTQAGALAFLVSDGKVHTSFALTWDKDRELYAKIMQMLEEEMEFRRRKGSAK